MEEVKENPQEQNDKINKQYEANLKRLVALFNGDKAFKKPKVNNSDVQSIIEELTKERKEELVKQFKEKASKLLIKKVEFDQFVKQKEEELKQALNNKKKEFSKEMEECFKLIESIDNIVKEYSATFEEISKPEKNN
jgi:hypothetical protein